MYGSTFKENIVATGYGMYMALPLLRKSHSPDMEEKDARALLEKCMTVLFYRDCRTINKVIYEIFLGIFRMKLTV